METKPHFFDLDPDAFAAFVTAQGMRKFRSQQVMDWVYRHGIADPAAMTNLPAAERDLFRDRLTFLRGRVVWHQRATDGTQKLLVEWDAPGKPRAADLPILGTGPDATDRQTECVMIPVDDVEAPTPTGRHRADAAPARIRRTACISSQVGCPVGCRFCASGLGGLAGNLSAGQIVEQVWQLARLPGVERISNVVFMGMGEPLSNFDQVTRAVRTLTADWGLGISGRKITISTVGLPAQIRRLADLDLPVTLAISLHAPNDEVRRRIIPWAEFVSIDQLLDAGRHYFDRTGREITLEYILLAGVNDRPEHARELAQVAKRLRSNVNLIRYNEVRGIAFGRPGDDDVLRFQSILRKAGVNVHIRASRGRDIAAACGQLRHESQRGPMIGPAVPAHEPTPA